MTGDGLANYLDGAVGNDSLVGGDGDDTLLSTPPPDFQLAPELTRDAVPDRDTMQGGLGKDTLDGGFDIDTAIYSEKLVAIQVAISGNDQVTVRAGNVAEDTLKNVENIIGGSGNDVISGDGFSNLFAGNAGNDVLKGFGGTDALQGDAGNDTLSGGSADDHLFGGLGSDVLLGGAGADRFSFTVASWGGDSIGDFERGDRLVFKRVIADSLSDFTITGNGTVNVTLAIGAQQLSLHGASPIALTAASFEFLA